MTSAKQKAIKHLEEKGFTTMFNGKPIIDGEIEEAIDIAIQETAKEIIKNVMMEDVITFKIKGINCAVICIKKGINKIKQKYLNELRGCPTKGMPYMETDNEN